MANRDRVITPEGRMMFPNLFEPSGFEGSEKQTYSCLLVFPNGTDLTPLNDAIKAAFVAKFPKGAAGAWNPVRDGNEKVDDWGEVFKDAKYIRVSSVFQPTVVNRKKQEILEKDQVYSGCYARAVVAPYAFDTRGNKGVAIGLDAVQILRDGEPLGGGSSSVKLFGDLDDLEDAGDNTSADPFN